MGPLPPGLPPDVAQHAIDFQQSLRQQPAGQSLRGGGVAMAVIVGLALGAIFVFKIVVPLVVFAILMGK